MLKHAIVAVALAAGAPAPAFAASPPATREGVDLVALSYSLIPAVVNITILKQRRHDNGHMSSGAEAMTTPITEVGSGFVIDPAGYIVTNRHVIAEAYRVTVTFSDMSAYPATVVATNEHPDLALLKINAGRDLPVVKFGDSSKVKIGDTVLAIGNPLGLATSVTSGIVSAINRDVRTSAFDNYIQTDAAINHGNSGGPLFNTAGEVIGVNWALIQPSTTGGSIGLGLSIPSRDAAFIVDQMRKNGRLKPGWIGIHTQQVTQDIADAAGLDGVRGALIKELIPGSPGARVLQVGDIVVGVNGQPVPDARELVRTVGESAEGTKLRLTVFRYGKSLDVDTTVEPYPADGSNPWGDWVMPNRGQRVSEPALGMKIEPLTGDLIKKFKLPEGQTGVAIVEIAANSPGADAGFKEGDVIVRIQDKPINSPQDLRDAWAGLRASGRASCLVLIRNEKGVNWVAAPVDPR